MVEKLRNPGRGRAVMELATRQHGVVGRWQLVTMGVSGRTIEGWVMQGRLVALHREVFAVGHRRIDRRGEWWCGVLAYGPGALISHRTAAAVWGLAAARGPVHVTAAGGRQGKERRGGFWLHRCRLHPSDWTEYGGLPVTGVARTLFDFAEASPFSELEQAWEDADRLGLLVLQEVAAVCERGRGRRALRPIGRLLAAARAPLPAGRSRLERRFLRFCRERGIPLPLTNVHVLGHEVDALWPDAKLIVELDSWEFHGHKGSFRRDRARDSKLLVAGYRTVRITDHRLRHEADLLEAELRALLTMT